MSEVEVTVAIRAQDTVGEAPFWDPATRTLTRVDLVTGRIMQWAGEDEVLETGRPAVGFAVPAGDRTLVYGAGHEIVLRTRDGDSTLATVPGSATVNDGAADSRGRLWFTTYARDGEPVADLHRVGTDGSLVSAGLGLRGPNGLGWSPDGRALHVVESQAGQLLTFDYDVRAGTLGPGRVAHAFSDADGTPDGLAVAADGCVWVAMLETGQLRSLSPDGQPLDVVDLPVSRPTNLAFVGGGDAWVTTARARLSEADLQDQPLAGSVLRVHLGTDGAPTHAARTDG